MTLSTIKKKYKVLKIGHVFFKQTVTFEIIGSDFRLAINLTTLRALSYQSTFSFG